MPVEGEIAYGDEPPVPQPETTYAFGPFKLDVGKRQIFEDDRPLRIGGRALELLHILISHAGEIVDKRTLLEGVWPGLHVEEANLRVHIGGLRRLLGDGRDGRRFIANEPGRGYRFVGALRQVDARAVSGRPTAPRRSAAAALSGRLTRVIGRAELVDELSRVLVRSRCLSIVGPGGIGKTTVALSIAAGLAEEFEDGVCVIDLAPLGRPGMVANAVALALELPARSEDGTEAVLAALRDRRCLLVMDNCEHVIDEAALLVEKICLAAPEVRVLATSREALAIPGERLHQLVSLDCPGADQDASASEVVAYPAVELFVERASERASGFRLTDGNSGLVAEICRRLDGMPLAIELAAGCVDAFGVEGVAKGLDDRFRLLTRGRRTALPRQRTLQLTLDWSYDLLSDVQQTVLRRLGTFTGSFSLRAAGDVACDGSLSVAAVVDAVVDLVSKSMVSVDSKDGETRYRLLETTRVYAREKLAVDDAREEASARHAAHYRSELEHAGASQRRQPLASLAPDLDNVRAALGWAFSSSSDVRVGISLAAAAAALLIDLGLLVECTAWTERALRNLGPDDRGTRLEMELNADFAMPFLFAQGNSDDVRTALERAHALARHIGDKAQEARLLDGLYVFHMRAGHFREMFEIAGRADQLAGEIGSRNPQFSWMAGLAHYFAGDHRQATQHLERALTLLPISRSIETLRIGVDHRVNAYNAYARSLWMQGRFEQAASAAARSVDEAETLGHAVSITIALMWTLPIALWMDDLGLAEARLERLQSCAKRAFLSPAVLAGKGFEGALAIRRGDAEAGVDLLRASLDGLRQVGNVLLEVVLMTHLAEGLLATARFSEAQIVTDMAMETAVARGETVNMPPLLLLAAQAMRADGAPPDEVAFRFHQALDWARRQGARAYEARILSQMSDPFPLQAPGAD